MSVCHHTSSHSDAGKLRLSNSPVLLVLLLLACSLQLLAPPLQQRLLHVGLSQLLQELVVLLHLHLNSVIVVVHQLCCQLAVGRVGRLVVVVQSTVREQGLVEAANTRVQR